MAKRTASKKAGQYTFNIITESDAREELAQLRGGRGGRTSKYESLAEAAQELTGDKVLKVAVSKNEVGGLRGYLQRRFDEKFTVRSSKVDGDKFVAFILLTLEEA